jgi:hypothetical protein
MNAIQYAFIVFSAVFPSIFYYTKYPLSTMFFMVLFAIATTYIVMYYIEPIFYIGSEKQCSIDA